MPRLGLVLSGGGARAAYEAGVMHYIRTSFSSRYSSKNFSIQSGSSAGAINAAVLASMEDNPREQGIRIKELWEGIRSENVFRKDFLAATHFLSSSFFGIVRNLATFNPLKSSHSSGPRFEFFLDTTPLRGFLKDVLKIDAITQNVKKGPVDALVIATTNARSGRTELFLSKKESLRYTGEYRFHEGPISVEQVMASAAIPIIFPSVKVNNVYYIDGGLRLFTPMSPAIHLGADRILMIGLRKKTTLEESQGYDLHEMKSPPSVAQLAGRVLNMLFIDRVEYDLEQLNRINNIIERSEKIFGKSYLSKINESFEKEAERKDIACRGLKKIEVLEITPSEFISKIYERWFNRLKKGKYKISVMEKLILRLLDIDAEGAIELLSYITFSQDYLKDLIELGYHDAEQNREELMSLLD